jgi:hypothetical protein
MRAIYIEKCGQNAGADSGTRTRDLRFTKPLLYQLSYVGRLVAENLSWLPRRLKAFQPQKLKDPLWLLHSSSNSCV